MAALAATLRAIAPPSVRVGARAIDPRDLDRLHALEASLVAGAVDRRREEFATGRALLHELVPGAGPIGRLANGAPSPPGGWTVTLAHDRALAVAAAMPARGHLGIDVEIVAPVPPADAAVILRPDDAATDALLAFVIKEAVYKTWSRPGRPLLEHHDVRLVAVAAGAFRAEVLVDGSPISGRYAGVGGHLVALAAHGEEASRRAGRS